MVRTRHDIDSDRRIRNLTNATNMVPYKNYADLVGALLSDSIAPKGSPAPNPEAVAAIRKALQSAVTEDTTFGEILTAIGQTLAHAGNLIVRDERRNVRSA